MKFPEEIFKTIETPFYFYDMSILRQTLDALCEASKTPGYMVHYAVKANANLPILRTINSYGLGADVVSEGEIRRVVECQIPPHKIVFAGVGKTDSEIEYALRCGIGCFNVESFEELLVIEEISRRIEIPARVAIRVNPQIDAHTHHYITTGLAENKFGVAMSMLDDIVRHIIESDSLEFRGLHFHIGSQIEIMAPYEELCRRICEIQKYFDELGISLPTINVGGGLGIDYDIPTSTPIPDFNAFFDTFRRNLPLRPGQQLHFELGRAIVGQCGSLISRVLYVKKGVDKKFVILDAGMTDLIRPALYGASHDIQNISASDKGDMERYDIVGPICESSDTFATDRLLPVTKRGDLIAILSAGAYGQTMASHYNCRRLPGELYSETVNQ